MTAGSEMERVATAGRGEILAWAMYDFANSAYTTVVATALFNPYFVKVVAGESAGLQPGQGTFLLTTSICIASLAIVLTAPIIGTIGDALACKKRLLLVSTIVCVVATAMLSQVGQGAYVAGIVFLVASNFAFGTGENLIAAFLPELAAKEDMGKVSAFGWAVGYIGGLSTLALCLWYISNARNAGQTAQDFIPVTMLITAAAYTIGAVPTFVFVKERARQDPGVAGARINFAEMQSFLRTGFRRLGQTLQHARRHQDLFRFLITLLIYSCGTSTVVSLASVYSQQAMGFTETDSVKLIFVVNITAALGAFGIGFVQDKLGSVRTLAIALCMWSTATVTAYFCTSVTLFWVVANVIGLAMGASGSAGRALVGLFSPKGRSGEFFGLWGLAGKMAAAIGPLSFGLVNLATGGDLRVALLSTTIFFIAGLLLLLTVNEKRGHEAALLASAAAEEVAK